MADCGWPGWNIESLYQFEPGLGPRRKGIQARSGRGPRTCGRSSRLGVSRRARSQCHPMVDCAWDWTENATQDRSRIGERSEIRPLEARARGLAQAPHRCEQRMAGRSSPSGNALLPESQPDLFPSRSPQPQLSLAAPHHSIRGVTLFPGSAGHRAVVDPLAPRELRHGHSARVKRPDQLPPLRARKHPATTRVALLTDVDHLRYNCSHPGSIPAPLTSR